MHRIAQRIDLVLSGWRSEMLEFFFIASNDQEYWSGFCDWRNQVNECCVGFESLIRLNDGIQ
jgi:hypothetical protein